MKFWNEIVTKYPDATNSRIAMCEFAKELKLNNADKQKCNGDFIPNEKEYKKEVTIKEFRDSPGFNVPMKTPKRKKNVILGNICTQYKIQPSYWLDFVTLAMLLRTLYVVLWRSYLLYYLAMLLF